MSEYLNIESTANPDGMFPSDLEMLLQEIQNLKNDLDQFKRYAELKIVAMKQRAGGNIPLASRYEKMCDEIFVNLHPKFKW